MGRINIVRLQRIAESWSIPGSRMNTVPDFNADLNLWVNYALFDTVGNFRKTNCDVGYFTHREEGPLEELFDRVAQNMDWCIAMCDKTARMLPPEKTTVVHTAPDPQFRKGNILLGIVGRKYPRKRLNLIPELRKIPGIDIRLTGGKLPFSQLPEFYQSIDYLLVLANNEGGPLPVLEALAMGKPVIAPDVGWCWDYPVIRYSGIDELLSTVKRLVVFDRHHESNQIKYVLDEVLRSRRKQEAVGSKQ